MKKLKKLGASLLALVMALAMVAPAMAAAPQAQIQNTDSSHTILYYQIFKGPKKTTGELDLENLEWGSAITTSPNSPATFWTALTSDTTIASKFSEEQKATPASANAAAAVLNQVFPNPGNTQSVVSENRELAAAIYNAVKSVTGVSVPATPASVDTGYYLFTDSTDNGASVSEYMLWNVVNTNNVNVIKPKTNVSSVGKQVFDPISNQYKDAAIYSGTQANDGDKIKFKITVTLPDNMDKATDYDLELVDTMASTLTYDKIESVTLYKGASSEAVLNDRYSVSTEGTSTFTLTIPDMHQHFPTYAGGTLEVIYTATFNADTVTGAGGNENKVQLKVNSLDVNEDTAEVYTLEVDVNKVDGAGDPLEGATFALIAEEDYAAVWNETDNKLLDGADESKLIPLTENVTRAEDGTTVTAVTHTAKNLTAGTYYLVETSAPGGYNAAKPRKLIINAEINSQTGLQVTLGAGSDSKFAPDSDMNVVGEVQNLSGTTLPETGGIGTTIFYIAGAALAIGAVVLLVTKRRVNSTDDE